ncbi:MAG: hypothetical protein ABIH25_01385 [Candidatus Woesearchaeota archaeon]
MTGHREDNIQFVKIDTPSVTRKNILEAAVVATTLLKRWESYKRIKEKKMLYVKKLKLIMGRIHREEMAFRRHFPHVGDDVNTVRKSKAIVAQRKHVVKAKSDLDREIDQIKAKLDRLG